MQLTVIPSVDGPLGTVPRKQEELEIKGRIETIQTMTFLISGRILEESWRFEETCHSESSERPRFNTGAKNSSEMIIIIIIIIIIITNGMCTTQHLF